MNRQASDYSKGTIRANGWMPEGFELYTLLGPDALADDRVHRLVAYWQSYLLLTAYAFENVYRAILTARGRSWRDALASKGGHGLAKHIASITPLNEDETSLVKRLETYLIWAGRYVVPSSRQIMKMPFENFESLSCGSDWTTAERLFLRSAKAVENECLAHEELPSGRLRNLGFRVKDFASVSSRALTYPPVFSWTTTFQRSWPT